MAAMSDHEADAESLRAALTAHPDVVSRGEELLGRLLDAGHYLHPEDLGTVVAAHGDAVGLDDLTLYLVDYHQRLLVPLPVAGRELEVLDINATVAGRAFRTQQPVVAAVAGDDARVRIWVPMLDGVERMGVVGATVAQVDDVLEQRLARLATIVAHMVASKSTYGDVIEHTRRRRKMDLAAELRWALLPPLTYTCGQVTVSGILEPAYEIAGDCFDYAVSGDWLNFMIVDAMGHGLEASRIANLAILVYRNLRREGAELIDILRGMDEVVADQFGPERFVTGQLGRLSLQSGRLEWLNAGHPRPLLLRNGMRLLDLEAEVCLPIGLGDVTAEVSSVSLEPGDTILFFTDGVTEARSPSGDEFGRDRLGDLLVRAAASGEIPPETLRRLSHAVLEHQEGTLQDDATLLFVQWAGGEPGA